MKLLLYFLFILSSCNREQNSTTQVVYVNTTYQMTLYYEDSIVNKFELIHLANKEKITGKAEIILVDGEIPEGTNRIDYSNPNDVNGYECGISYDYTSLSTSIAFAVEKGNKRRLDLIVDSKGPKIEEGHYTLFNKDVRPSR